MQCFCVFYKLFTRDFVLQFVISWRAPVTRVLHMLGNNYKKKFYTIFNKGLRIIKIHLFVYQVRIKCAAYLS